MEQQSQVIYDACTEIRWRLFVNSGLEASPGWGLYAREPAANSAQTGHHGAPRTGAA